MNTGYKIKPILCGRHLEIFRDGRCVGNIIAPIPEVTSNQWSLALAEPSLRIRTFPTKADCLRFLGISDERRAA